MVEIVLEEDQSEKNARSTTGGADVENGRVYCLLSRYYDFLVTRNSTAWNNGAFEELLIFFLHNFDINKEN